MGVLVSLAEAVFWRGIQVAASLSVFALSTGYDVPVHVDFMGLIEHSPHKDADLLLGSTFVGVLCTWNVQSVELAQFHEVRSDHGATKFALLFHDKRQSAKPGQRRVTDALLCRLVVVHERRAA